MMGKALADIVSWANKTIWILRQLGHCHMASLQSLKEKKFKQSIEIDYIDNTLQMNQIDMHITNLFKSTAFTVNTLGHCPMALTLKTKNRKNLVNKILNA